MRVLFCSLASPGHTYPLIPLASAFRDAGHEVRWAAGDNVHAELSRQSLRPFRPGDAFYEFYAEDIAPELERLRPDLVVHGWGLTGVAEAVRAAGVRSLWHGFGRLYPEGIGLERPDSAVPHVDLCPPSLQSPDFTAERLPLRPVPYSAEGPVPEPGDRTMVYLSLGTAFGTREVLSAAVSGVAALGVRVVVAAGRVELGPVPDNVEVHEWVSQPGVLRQAAAVVHHGGSGTVLAACSYGLPQLLLPQGADQFANAEAVTGAGAGLTLLETDADAVTENLLTLLGTPGHREAARLLAQEVAALPSPEDLVRELAR